MNSNEAITITKCLVALNDGYSNIEEGDVRGLKLADSNSTLLHKFVNMSIDKVKNSARQAKSKRELVLNKASDEKFLQPIANNRHEPIMQTNLKSLTQGMMNENVDKRQDLQEKS